MRFYRPSQWNGYVEPEFDAAAARPWPEACGATPPLPDVMTQAAVAAGDGAPLARQAWLLETDPGDKVARSLASFARSLLGYDA